MHYSELTVIVTYSFLALLGKGSTLELVQISSIFHLTMNLYTFWYYSIYETIQLSGPKSLAMLLE